MSISKHFDIEPLQKRARGMFGPWGDRIDTRTSIHDLFATIVPEKSLGLNEGVCKDVRFEYVKGLTISNSVRLRARFDGIQPRLDGLISEYFVQVKNEGEDESVVAHAIVTRFHAFTD